MRKKTALILILSLILILAFAGPALAQDGEVPEETPEEEVCAHPVAGLFDAYYGSEEAEETEGEGEGTGEGETTGEGEGETEEAVSICEEVTTYHEDGMGWGVLTKLYAIAAESQEACDGEPDCGVTVAELIEQFQSGKGMGQLFKEYGKPSMMGVGHLRKAVNCGENGNGVGNANGKNKSEEAKDKEKGNNGNGKSNGKGSEHANEHSSVYSSGDETTTDDTTGEVTGEGETTDEDGGETTGDEEGETTEDGEGEEDEDPCADEEPVEDGEPSLEGEVDEEEPTELE